MPKAFLFDQNFWSWERVLAQPHKYMHGVCDALWKQQISQFADPLKLEQNFYILGRNRLLNFES